MKFDVCIAIDHFMVDYNKQKGNPGCAPGKACCLAHPETFFQLHMLFIIENLTDLQHPGKKLTPDSSGLFFSLN